jgi:hypothetical protein
VRHVRDLTTLLDAPERLRNSISFGRTVAIG